MTVLVFPVSTSTVVEGAGSVMTVGGVEPAGGVPATGSVGVTGAVGVTGVAAGSGLVVPGAVAVLSPPPLPPKGIKTSLAGVRTVLLAIRGALLLCSMFVRIGSPWSELLGAVVTAMEVFDPIGCSAGVVSAVEGVLGLLTSTDDSVVV